MLFVTVLAAHSVATFAAKPASMLEVNMYHYCCEACKRYDWRSGAGVAAQGHALIPAQLPVGPGCSRPSGAPPIPRRCS